MYDLDVLVANKASDRYRYLCVLKIAARAVSVVMMISW